MKKILIVDDSADLIQELTEQLVKHNYEVHSVTDGQQALNAVTSLKPDLVLMDIVMPGMNGFETLRELKKLPVEPPHIFMISTKAAKTDELWAKRQGAEAYFTKPVDYDALLTTIKDTLKD